MTLALLLFYKLKPVVEGESTMIPLDPTRDTFLGSDNMLVIK
jgi:hypothetical protein